MSIAARELVEQRSANAPAVTGRQRRAQPVTNRVRRDGKFFRLGDSKFYVKGVTYGPFEPDKNGDPFYGPEQTGKDFDQIAELGANCVRIYHVPPTWFLDLAQQKGLKVFLDVAWPKNLSFVDSAELTREAHKAVRRAARACGNHAALFAISVVNEIPADMVRFYGRERVEQFIDDLVHVVKSEAPNCLVTFANFPTTEYLQPRETDFVCFNVYLHDDNAFRNYLARLQSNAGEKPVMLGEYGIDTHREKTEEQQAEILAAHVRAVFDEGLAGTFIFSFTDDWFSHGWQIDDWKFGIVRKDRTPKPAYHALKPLLHRVPQVADVKLPKISVIICSYNGASTVESCLRSMERLKYPDFEVIFVDDGSRDSTQQILTKFPWVKNIRQKNMGLSYARNVGMNAATGEIIAYTDSDCEADEDWLYYLGLAMVRSKHIGMGGPNLIPDEGSWVADCVGLSPGGPTHVMIDDRTAEHVPGCNMAFYTWAAKLINGFDSQFRKAGDDVDFIWRLQHLGYSIGFAPAAQVWHYRRNTIQAYLKQQRGYGEAEAMLKFKHPDHFNTLGASSWRGRIYGGDQIGVRVGRNVIYHGVFGSGLFQTMYRRQASLLAAMLMSVEWHLLTGFVFILGLAFVPLVAVGVAMLFVPVILATIAAMQAPAPKHKHWLTRPLIAYLHLRQPIARGWARYSVRLRAKVLQHEAKRRGKLRPLPFEPGKKRTLRYWSTYHDRIVLLQKIKEEVTAAGWRLRLDSGWNGWDMEIYGSRYVKVRLTTMSEHHHANERGLLTRVRVELLPSTFCKVLMFASAIMTGLLFLYVWPFSRPGILIPLLLWTMYLANKALVGAPVLSLIDECAEKAGYYPVLAPADKAAQARQAQDEEDLDLEESPSVAEYPSMSFYLRALSYFRKDLPGIFVSLVLILLSSFATLLQPFPLAVLIDSVFQDKPSTQWIGRMLLAITPDDKLQRIIALAVITLVLRLIQEALTLGQSLVAIRVGYAGLMRVRCDLFEKLQSLSLAYHKSQPQGDAIYRLSNDTFAFQAILNTFINAILVSIVTLLVMAVIMFGMSWRLTLIALSIAPVLMWLTDYGWKVIRERWTKAKQVDSELTTAIQRSVAAISLVQAFGREASEYARFRTTVQNSVTTYVRVHWVELLHAMMIGVVFAIAGGVIFGYGGYLVYQDQIVNKLGESGMTVGTLYVFMMYLGQLYAPLQRLTGAGATLQSAAVSAVRVFEVLDRDPIIMDAPDAVSMALAPRTLEIDRISFEYLPGTPVFQDVSLTLKPGAMVGLVGFSGVGKSTLLSLLPRFYDPAQGSIKLDGQDIRKIKISDLRKHLALVLQESIVLPTTILENIAYGKPEATDAEIRKAAEMARAAEFIEKLPLKYDTLVSESGSNLSGGQRQRLAIARALLTEAPILVLDEPTSALDPQNELAVVQALYGLRGSRTIILVSHRISTVADCDEILVMHEGRLVERGTHQQLLAMGGTYYLMAKHQLKLEEKEPQPS